MTPEKLNELYLFYSKEYYEEKALDLAIEKTLEKAIEKIKSNDSYGMIKIKNQTILGIEIYDCQIKNKLKLLGYKTSETTSGWEEHRNTVYYLHFGL